MPSFQTLLLWLLVMNLGIAFGAGLYESRIVLPQWLEPSADGTYHWNAAAARAANTGLKFWIYVTTVPLTLLTIANLIAAWRSGGMIRNWWLGAVAVVAAERIMTFSYFIPTMVKLQYTEALPQSEAVATALQWAQVNYLRHALILIAWLAALMAFSLSGERRI